MDILNLLRTRKTVQEMRDHIAREDMLDALWLHYWDETEAWEKLVQIVADYTRETSGVKTP